MNSTSGVPAEPTDQQRAELRRLLGQLTDSLGRHLGTAARVTRFLGVSAALAALALLVVVLLGWPPRTVVHWVLLAALALLVVQPTLTLLGAASLLRGLSTAPWSMTDVPAAGERALDRVLSLAEEARTTKPGLRPTIHIVRKLRSVQDDLDEEIPGLAQLMKLADPGFTARLGIAVVGTLLLMGAIPLVGLAALIT